MKISAIKINSSAVEKGVWVKNIPDMGDLAIKSRGIGNVDWTKKASVLWQATPRSQHDDPQEAFRINVECLVETAILGWNIEDDAGKPVPFTKDALRAFLLDPDYRPFYNACVVAAGRVQNASAADVEYAAKN